eukprot:5660052-Prymnesium_polylepis.1
MIVSACDGATEARQLTSGEMTRACHRLRSSSVAASERGGRAPPDRLSRFFPAAAAAASVAEASSGCSERIRSASSSDANDW